MHHVLIQHPASPRVLGSMLLVTVSWRSVLLILMSWYTILLVPIS